MSDCLFEKNRKMSGVFCQFSRHCLLTDTLSCHLLLTFPRHEIMPFSLVKPFNGIAEHGSRHLMSMLIEKIA